MFDLLVTMGYKQIEVGFPSASQTDFDFVRQLIEEDMIPDDVTIQVLTQAREELIERTYESIEGAKQAIVHLYNSTSILQRDVVFRTDKQGIIDIALQGARKWCEQYEATIPGTTVYYEYSPGELHGHRARVRRRRLQPGHRGLRADARAQGHHQPAGDGRDGDAERLRRLDRVDVAAPRPPRERDPDPAPAQRPRHGDRRRRARLPGRRRPHRGLPVRQRRAHRQRRPRRARHQPVHAGHRPADRLQRHRRDPAHRRVLQPAARCTSAARGPATSSTRRSAARHQDAIKKGFEAMEAEAAAAGVAVAELEWAVPYLPVDPKDLGRGYEAVIRVNSQSGKGGVAYLLKTDHALDLPRRLQIEFSRRRAGEDRCRGRRGHERRRSGRSSRTSTCRRRPIARRQVGPLRAALARAPRASSTGVGHPRHPAARSATSVEAARGTATDPIAAFLEIMATQGHDDPALRLRRARAQRVAATRWPPPTSSCRSATSALWGVGIDADISTASLKAVVSAVNRAVRTESGRSRAESSSV